jgi:hypothetical protein
MNQRKRTRGNTLDRIEKLEARFTDCSHLVPGSPAWLRFWRQQIMNYLNGEPHVPLTLEAMRAYLQQATPDGVWELGEEAPA